MRQYVIDELRPEDHRAVKDHLDQAYGTPGLDSVYWVPLAEELYTAEQRTHTACHPLYFAWELEWTRLACELLVRPRNQVRCSCIANATPKQREWMISQADAMIDTLSLKL